MANKKQQRRKLERARDHSRRPADGPREPRPERSEARGSRSVQRRTGGRTPQAPSYARAARRAGLFAAFWFAVLSLTPLGEQQTTIQNAFTAVTFFAVLWPVGYLTERFAYARFQRRLDKPSHDRDER